MFGKTTALAPHDENLIHRTWPLDDEPLVRLGNGDDAKHPENDFCLAHAFTGVQIFGATGSGKTPPA